jgi:hypothetical protein
VVEVGRMEGERADLSLVLNMVVLQERPASLSSCEKLVAVVVQLLLASQLWFTLPFVGHPRGSAQEAVEGGQESPAVRTVAQQLSLPPKS